MNFLFDKFGHERVTCCNVRRPLLRYLHIVFLITHNIFFVSFSLSWHRLKFYHLSIIVPQSQNWEAFPKYHLILQIIRNMIISDIILSFHCHYISTHLKAHINDNIIYRSVSMYKNRPSAKFKVVGEGNIKLLQSFMTGRTNRWSFMGGRFILKGTLGEREMRG